MKISKIALLLIAIILLVGCTTQEKVTKNKYYMKGEDGKMQHVPDPDPDKE